MLEVRRRNYQVRGRPVTREYVHVPDVVVVVYAEDAQGCVLAVRRYRAALDGETLELPAGKVEPGETPEAAARHDLEEETGHRAARVEPLLRFWPSPGCSDQLMHVFSAKELSETAMRPTEGDALRLVRLTPEACVAAMRSGEMRDGPSLLVLLAVQAGFRVLDG